ncbi:MAG: VanZ family protein [Oscillospiraceae bacterium]|nr:VanZ family protein [Oscillospiraceae bacterium]
MNYKNSKNFKNSESDPVTVVLLILYLFALVWIILFKLSFDLVSLPHLRSVNLIPFAESFGRSEMLNNCIVFIPYGILVSMLRIDWSFWQKICPIFLTSLFLEFLQYVFYIGASDITDLILNTAGGILGIALVSVLFRIFHEKILDVLKIGSILACIVLIFLFSMLILENF